MTNHDSAIVPLMFHSTVVMNFVTWDAMVCAYPRMLRDSVGLANTDRMNRRSRLDGPLQKYRDRGFRVLRSASEWDPRHVCGQNRYCGATERRLSDAAVMRVSLSNLMGDPIMSFDGCISWKLAVSRRCLAPDEPETSTPGWVKNENGLRFGEYHDASTVFVLNDDDSQCTLMHSWMVSRLSGVFVEVP